MEDDPDAWRKPWVYDEHKHEFVTQLNALKRLDPQKYQRRLEENRQQRLEREAKRDKVRDARLAEFGPEGRRWAIWKRRKTGATLKKVGEEFGLTPERVRQMVMKCDRKIRKALNHEWNNVPDEVRNATLGVEFVFRNEVTFTGWNGDRGGWDQVEPEEYGSMYWPPTPEWRTDWGEQDTRPAKPRKVYTYYKTIIHEGADDES